MSRSIKSTTGPNTLPRFGLTARAVHWSFSVLMIICILTAAVLYNGQISVLAGHRRTVELIHVYAGFGLPIPLILGFCSSSYRRDLRRLNRFTRADWRWLRSRTRRDGTIRVGKFNAGQKINAALSTGAMLVLLGTGIIMYFTNLARLSWRTGATFIHDWFALGIGLLVIGHIVYALKSSEALRGMWTGRVSTAWARTEHAAWADELTPPATPPEKAAEPRGL